MAPRFQQALRVARRQPPGTGIARSLELTLIDERAGTVAGLGLRALRLGRFADRSRLALASLRERGPAPRQPTERPAFVLLARAHRAIHPELCLEPVAGLAAVDCEHLPVAVTQR